MVEKGRFLVVVAVLEGRRFPKRPRHQLVVEAKFDGEVLTTDPVDHVENPDVTQELAWELDKKGLQQHRLQRTSIKIQCYALDTSTSVKEAIGYVVLDLRSAHNKQTSKWYPLLLGKYQKNKPEIRLGLYLDEDKTTEENTSFKAKEAPARLIEETPLKDKNANQLKPVLNEEEGFYQLGPPKQCADQFVLSVTIATASNLAQLIPSTMALPQGGGYFFYFSLFGNDVTNEVFNDLINPQFPAERASVRIRSSVEAIRMFFSSQPGLQVHLCCGDQSLGRAEVPLNSLLKKNSTEIYMKPVSVEGSFELVPPNKAKQQMSAVPGGLSPVVGLSVVLRKEDMAMRSPVKEGAPSPIRSVPHSPRSPVHKHQPHPEHRSPGKGERPQGPSSPTLQRGGAEASEYEDDFEVATHDNVSSIEEDKQKAQKKSKDPDQTEVMKPASRGAQTGASPGGPVPHLSDSTSTTQHHVAIPPQSHHFAFSIDLRSVRSLDNSNTQHVFLRYTYPFFGSAAPILTHPPVEIRKGMEVLLPQSFCAFDFACNMQQLQETFLRVPLMVELWNRDRQLSKDVFLGAARLPLADVIVAEKTKQMNQSGSSGWKQLYSNKVPAISNESPGKPIGEISFVLSLEDWGPISTQQIVVAKPESSGTMGIAENQPPTQSPRETEEYKAALELEMWKEEQEHVFENQLKQKEMMYMKALAEEWKKRDRERELLMKKKLTEYAQLEEQLRKTLLDLEKREKQLAANEQEVMRLKADLQRDHDRKLQEMKEASRRMKDDCDHLVDLEKGKSKELESLIQRYKDELTEAEKRKAKVEKDFTVYKEELNTKPEVRLQSEINLLTLEKVELERKMDAVTKSKLHYKQQWGRALKELARLKQKEQAQAKASLVKQQQELEHMRLRYLAAEEKDVVNTDKQELEDIKHELNKLKLMEEDRLKGDGMSPRETVGVKSGVDCGDMDRVEEHISRLIEERDTLLRTGVYNTQDKIIAELDRQIREALANRKLNNV
ncbi:CE120-like protein [Mya arenaria]|uniref:CE120-like protein n=1 Tax=Mya arenaria TaxID=6604 RepID=A0ABY7DSD4_MYAAR|nr:centrosomal protein of 120 kDa-like [Mya arenaria]WAR00622.1 CE120-like protein [Mya arenaria]